MQLLIYPGIHNPSLTHAFWQQLHPRLPSDPKWLGMVSAGYSTLCAASGLRLLTQLGQSPAESDPLSVVAFSAGVVGASQLIPIWQLLGGRIACLIALDGWGVPLAGSFPILRLSHDWFTAWSSRYLSTPETVHFYADPAVSHLTLWAEPDQVTGQYLSTNSHFGIPSNSPLQSPPLTVIDRIVQTLMAHNPALKLSA